jgi:hypothetical protein
MKKTTLTVVVALVVGAAALYASRATPYPLQSTPADRVIAITFSDHHNHRVRISSPTDIQFVLDHTRNLPSNSEQKVTVEFEIVVELQNEPTIRLRMSKECIGPDVAASAGVTRWYFQDSILYDFVKERFGERG